MSNKLHFALVLALLASVAYTLDLSNGLSIIPTDQNFTLDTFFGDWNIVAVYGIDGITTRSCPVLKSKKQPLNTTSISISATNISNSGSISSTKVYQQSKSNHGILVDLLSLHPQDIAVSYYNASIGQAILINVNSLFALALAKAQSVDDNNFSQTVTSIFGEALLPANETYLTSAYGCSTNLTFALNFAVAAFPGNYYGNAIFTASGVPQGLGCFSVQIAQDATQSNKFVITYFSQYSNGTTANVSASYVNAASNNAFLINIDSPPTVSMVVNHYDAGDHMFILVAHDSSVAYVVSTKPDIDQSTVKYVQGILERDGLVLNSQTFLVPPDLCPAGAETLIEF